MEGREGGRGTINLLSLAAGSMSAFMCVCVCVCVRERGYLILCI